jgi:hypothetical protein
MANRKNFWKVLWKTGKPAIQKDRKDISWIAGLASGETQEPERLERNLLKGRNGEQGNLGTMNALGNHPGRQERQMDEPQFATEKRM